MTSLKEWCVENKREDLLSGYDYENNPNPDEISKGIHTKLSWICSICGDHFSRAPHNISTKTENRCRICHQKRIAELRHLAAVRKTNFVENYPKLAEEWDFSKNNLLPEYVSYNDNRQYYWICKNCGSSFKSVIANRIKGSQCPRCNAIWHTSFPEQTLFYYIERSFSDAVLRDKSLGRELDVYIPSEHCGIEYDGLAWHRKEKHINNDQLKEQLCFDKGIRLIRIREKGLDDIIYTATTDVRYVESGNDNDLEEAIRWVLDLLHVASCDVDVDRDRNEILSRYLSAKKVNSLSVKFPELVKEWDYTGNKPITPESIDYGSGYSAWWICSVCNYRFQTTVNARTCKGSGCPACCNFVLNPGKNDFVSWCKANEREDLLQQWDFEKNKEEGIDIEKVIHRGGNVKANWICPNGHKYKQLIYNRTVGKGCMICARERHKKKCRNIDTGEVFGSIKEAGSVYNISPGKISMACKGQRKTAKGYRWEFVE